LAEHQGRPVHGGAPLVLRTRAERIEAGWFDGEPVCRDYHVAEGADQRLRWVFRQRRGDQQSWFLHGWFN
jgi:protein ImuB